MPRSPISRTLAAALAAVVATSPGMAVAKVHTVTVDAHGFTPKYVNVKPGDTVTWVGLDRTTSIAAVNNVATVDANEVCVAPSSDPAHVNAYKRAFDPAQPNELTGPTRNGVSGIWALGPEGDAVSDIEIPSAEAAALGVFAAGDCGALDRSVPDPDDPARTYKYHYAPNEDAENPEAISEIQSPDGIEHSLCKAITQHCDTAGLHCEDTAFDPTRTVTIPPGTYASGLLTSTYANPDLTGVILRFNWKNLQVDRDGSVVMRWDELDRELERAIAHGKLVTLDIRAGMFGTPSWIFLDYLDHTSTAPAPWCTGAGCAFIDAHPAAGTVEAITFLDYYDEPSPTGCGSPVRIGAPGDPSYVALYTDLIAKLAAHVAEDTRRFNAVAHVKISGANLRTSEAELPHHCDDAYSATADHVSDPKAEVNPGGDGVLDVYKTLDPISGVRKTASCVCNTQVWFEHGYTPQQLYDYYAQVEGQIATSFFGRKSLGYQILQDGFPRTDVGGFLGDHLYQERLVSSTTLRPVGRGGPTCGDGIVDASAGEECDDANADDTDGCFRNCRRAVLVNAAYESATTCTLPDIGADGEPAVHEDRVAPAVSYCSADEATLPAGASHVSLAIEPVEPLVTDSVLSLASPPTSYPRASAQSEEVLDQAGNGRFSFPSNPFYVNRALGKLFTPQHSGLQPISQERVALGYPTSPSSPSGKCKQEQARLVAPTAAQGPYVAAFPILAAVNASHLSDPDASGCPNHWIVDQGKDQDVVTLHIGLPPMPPLTIELVYPPQLTGFQTTNKVRGPRMVESALFNLVYNSNAVFVELYEDAIWRIATAKGAGSTATIDATWPGDPGAPVRTLNNVCDQLGAISADHCYSKSLGQWAEELHARRAMAAALWSTYGGLSFPALADPFPTSYSMTFTNSTGVEQYYSYIDASHCTAADVLSGPPLLGMSALGVIRVAP